MPVFASQPEGFPDSGFVPNTSSRIRLVPVCSVPFTVTTPVASTCTSPPTCSEPPRAELMADDVADAQLTAFDLLSIVPNPNRSAWSLMSFADVTTAPADTMIRLSDTSSASESTLSTGIALPANVSVRDVSA